MKFKVVLFLVGFSFSTLAQEQIDLSNLDSFKDQAGNWEIVGDISVNRNIDVHDNTPHSEASKRKRRRKKNRNKQELPKPIASTSGTGILLNINTEEKNDALITNWEHGDLILELDVLLPKGSNSGIYFQGRYELQLKDSWGVKKPLGSDMGGFHNNWEKEEDKIFRGIPPMSNASKAPGLWQNYKIHFQAPRFNESGEKISNAKFISVELNGVLIHSNVEVPTYTGGPIQKNEVAKGPLLIQGNHGPVAFRNIKYQILEESSVELKSLNYIAYKGEFKGLDELSERAKVSSGKANKIDVLSIGEEDNYGIMYIGTFNVGKDDDYTIDIGYSGGVKLIVDNKTLLENNSSSEDGVLQSDVKLTAGIHKFILVNIKSAGWRAPKLGMTIKSKSTNPISFNTYESYPPRVNKTMPIYVDAGSTPRILRAFVAFRGDQEQRLSHTIGVGMPSNLNYIYDLSSGNVVGVWRGDFVDATPMWHERGDGSFKPRGSVQWLFLNQSVAELSSMSIPFPKIGGDSDFVSKGYHIDKSSGLPIFNYKYKNIDIEDKTVASKDDKYLIRELKFSINPINTYLKIASGKIVKNTDGSYTVGDRAYYINMLSGQTPIVRDVNGETELILLIDGSNIKYEIIW